VIDTAFGVFSPTYQSTGTVQYTTTTSGYRYSRSDTVDQTNLFSGTDTSTNRPNVKFVFAPVTAGPQIGVAPTSLTYGSVAVGASSTQSFTIINTGGSPLSGTITTPTGYSIVAQSREERDVLSFSLGAGLSRIYNLSFNPTAATSYNGDVVINSNSETQSTFNLAVTGAGYNPPTISLDTDFLGAGLLVGEETTDSFAISNIGSLPLNYTIGLTEVRSRGTATPTRAMQLNADKNITGSTVVVDVTEYTPGITENWTFTVTNASTDTEWLKHVYITFPTGVVVNSCTNLVGGDGGEMVPTPTSGNGITVDWFGESSSGWGLIQGNNDSAVATVNVTIPAGMSAPIQLAYQLNGDVYGAEPHVLTGSISLTASVPPVQWFSAAPLSGTVAAGTHDTITGYFSAVGMEPGVYEALLTISSNDPVNPIKEVQVMMEVVAGNRPPVITLPASFTFPKNGSLVQSFASYISDPDADPITLSVSGNSNVTVDISGSSVTFGAVQNWCGTETMTFAVYDGELYAYDNVDIIVTPTDMPEWEPVVYPTNPATVYASVTIDGIPAQLNDIVAAFVGNECRGTGEIVLIRPAVAYTTLVVNLATSGETVSFKIYSHSEDAIYPVPEEMPMVSGAVYGETTPVPLNATTSVVIARPIVAIQNTMSGTQLSWNAVQHALNYQIWACSEPYGTYTYVGSTSSLSWQITPSAAKMFYKIIADNTAPTKGTK
jgi:hypothetical protein